MAEQPHVQSGVPGALNVAGAILGGAARSGKLPPWAAHLINTLLTVVTLFFGSQFLPDASAPAVPAVEPAVVNPDGTMTVTKEQRAAWRHAWTQHARQQVLRDIAQTIKQDHSPEAVLNLVLGLAFEATAPLPAEHEEETP